MTAPDLASPPPDTKPQPYRFLVSGIIPAHSKPDAATQVSRAVEKAVRKVIGQMGGEVSDWRVEGVAISAHIKGGISG